MTAGQHFRHFLDALSFLTRLVPPRPISLAACVPWFAPAGLLLGFVLTLVTVPVFAWIVFWSSVSGSALLAALPAAWIWLCLEILMTRALHWDGLADLADACGSAASGQRFWEVLRDSRLGAFGALALLLVFCGQWAALCLHLAAWHWLVPVLAPAWGRACSVWLACGASAHDPGSLGGLTIAGAGKRLSRLHWGAALLCLAALCALGLHVWQALVLLIGQCWMLRQLAGIARKQGGLSGDFLGAGIETGQLWFLLATL
jgi:adenosylcobinamide-GDP ribazoletransferase